MINFDDAMEPFPRGKGSRKFSECPQVLSQLGMILYNWSDPKWLFLPPDIKAALVQSEKVVSHSSDRLALFLVLLWIQNESAKTFRKANIMTMCPFQENYLGRSWIFSGQSQSIHSMKDDFFLLPLTGFYWRTFIHLAHSVVGTELIWRLWLWFHGCV